MRAYYAKYNWEVSQLAIDDAFNLLDKNNDNSIDKSELFKYINLMFKGAY